MDLDYDAQHEAFRAEVRAFLEASRQLAPTAPGEGSPTHPKARAWQKLLLERGYAARTIPREYGGYGAEPDLLAAIVIDEEFRRAGLPRGFGGQGVSMLVPTLLEHGSEAQKRRFIPPTLTGEIIWCQGYSEPGAGSDLASLSTRADDDGDAFVVNGQKIWTSTAQIAQMMFLLARTEPDEPRHGGLSYLLLSMDTPGIQVRPLQTMTGSAEFNQVFFRDVRVPKENLVGGRGEGWKIGNTTLRHERNMLGSASQSEDLYAELVELLRRETLDGRPAIEQPVWRDRLMRLQARVLALKYHALRLLTHELRGEPPGVAGLVTKLVGCELNHDLAALALDALGELGLLYDGSPYLRANGHWQYQYMFSLGLIIGGGTAQIQKNIIGERGLGLPREPRPPAPDRHAAASGSR